jgi:exoribonuclease R
VTGAPLQLSASAGELVDDFARVRADLAVPDGFSPEVESDAAAVAARGPLLPPGVPDGARVDARSLELVTIDPPGSRDLDQAFHAERLAAGWRVHYAIADVAAFVTPGGALDREAFARGVTLYLPDGRAPLYPSILGEGEASLLPDVDRPALLWTFDLDADGAVVSTTLARATVRSRAALGYREVQRSLDDGSASPALVGLREVGAQLIERERARGGVSLAAPTQEVVKTASGDYELELEQPLPVEGWNAQISLLTGMEAARAMDAAGVGLVRVLPTPESFVVDRLRRTAAALGIPWPETASYADVVRGMVPSDRRRATFLLQALHTMRGAGYAVIVPGTATPTQSAVGAAYAHVTAPLRRLADRFANELLLAHFGGYTAPVWAVDALPELVATMQRANQHAAAVDRACVDAIELALLAGHVGDAFAATVVDRHRRGIVVMLHDADIVVTVPGRAELGAEVSVRLEALDRTRRTATFALHAPGPR